MRLLIPPPGADGRLLVVGSDGAPVGELWTARFHSVCAGRRLDARIIATAPIDAPVHEPSEPVSGAIARLVAATRGRQALVAVMNPAEALGAERIAFADGVRLFGIGTAEDETSWDAMLTLGLPVWGWRGTMVLDAQHATVSSAWSAIAFGLFHAAEGTPLAALDEDRAGVAWQSSDPSATTTAIIRGGFEDGRLGAAGRRADRGNEVYVRLVIRSSFGDCWTQPRFIVPARRGLHG